MTNYEKLEILKDQIFATNDSHCFIERDRILTAVKDCEEKPSNYYATLFSELLEQVSTPACEEDIFVGRVLEGPTETDVISPNKNLCTIGHMIPDYHRLLTKGYRGVLEDIKENAKGINTAKAYSYAENAEIVVDAIRCFSIRYAQAAKEVGNSRAYEALLRVPYEPAYDLYSALQGIWMVHMLASCHMGSRDYGFGYMDEYLYPYYIMEKEKGTTDQEICEMLAGFFIKANEICGRCTHNYKQKPILSVASKQYVLLDGGRANKLSELILEAAKMNCMAQPEFTVIISKNASDQFVDKVYQAMEILTDKLQVYNYELLKEYLTNRKLPEDISSRPAFHACCTFCMAGRSYWEEFYLPTVQLFCDVLYNNVFSTKEDFMKAYAKAIADECKAYLERSRRPGYEWMRKFFTLDALLLGECNENCDYPPYGLQYRVKNVFLPGLATLGDSLSVLDNLVFKGEMPYTQLIDILKKNYEGHEDLLEHLATLQKFGNDEDIDCYTVEMAELMLEAVKNAEHMDNEIVVPGFYSLERDNSWAQSIPATPDGRKAGTPFSENQSPVYGADKKGITALLNSLSKIPFYKTATGGMNLAFSSKVDADILRALITTYFQKGGIHVGISVLDKKILKDAMKHPEKYKTLTVRLYGFSEYFINLPEWQQIAVLNRTVY